MSDTLQQGSVRVFGCARCRQSSKGCSRCRKDDFRPRQKVKQGAGPIPPGSNQTDTTARASNNKQSAAIGSVTVAHAAPHAAAATFHEPTAPLIPPSSQVPSATPRPSFAAATFINIPAGLAAAQTATSPVPSSVQGARKATTPVPSSVPGGTFLHLLQAKMLLQRRNPGGCTPAVRDMGVQQSLATASTDAGHSLGLAPPTAAADTHTPPTVTASETHPSAAVAAAAAAVVSTAPATPPPAPRVTSDTVSTLSPTASPAAEGVAAAEHDTPLPSSVSAEEASEPKARARTRTRLRASRQQQQQQQQQQQPRTRPAASKADVPAHKPRTTRRPPAVAAVKSGPADVPAAPQTCTASERHALHAQACPGAAAAAAAAAGAAAAAAAAGAAAGAAVTGPDARVCTGAAITSPDARVCTGVAITSPDARVRTGVAITSPDARVRTGAVQSSQTPGPGGGAELDMRVCTWEPPASPYGLIEEVLFQDPWKLLLACVLLNRTSGVQVRKVLWPLLRLYPSPAQLMAADAEVLEGLLRPLGLFRKRAQSIRRFSQEYVHTQWTCPKQLHGIGQYAADAYNIFCRGQWQGPAPADKDLRKYHEWLVSTDGSTKVMAAA
ncbi:MAG: hypothetical protein WDW38_007797 [Sanguina aurantia]